MHITEGHSHIVEERNVRLSNLITPIMTELIGPDVDVNLIYHKQSTYSEFISSLSNGFTYYVDKMQSEEEAAYHWSFNLPPIKGRIEIDFSLPLSLAIWDFLDKERSGLSVLGPRLISNDEYFSMTDVIGETYLRIVNQMPTCWEFLFPTTLEKVLWEPVPSATMIHPDYDTPLPDEVVVHSALQISTQLGSGEFHICYPSTVLESIISLLKKAESNQSLK